MIRRYTDVIVIHRPMYVNLTYFRAFLLLDVICFNIREYGKLLFRVVIVLSWYLILAGKACLLILIAEILVLIHVYCIIVHLMTLPVKIYSIRLVDFLIVTLVFYMVHLLHCSQCSCSVHWNRVFIKGL